MRRSIHLGWLGMTLAWLAGAGCGGAAGDVVVVPPGAPGNPDGRCAVPAAGQAEDVSHPTTVVGDGSKESCTAQAFEDALAAAGVITFDCGPDPVTIAIPHEIRLYNKAGANGNGDRVIDGGGKITLDGGGRSRILYQNGCEEALGWLNAHCQNHDHPRLTVQNITFANGHATANAAARILGGGAIYVEGGLFKAVNTRFVHNTCDPPGPDYAGGAIYTIKQYAPGGVPYPIYLVNSTFGGGDGLGNSAASGGAIGGIGVSYAVLNSIFSHNRATGAGMSDGNGGNGGAIYNDGNTYQLTLCGTGMMNNSANELGGAIFYVSNDLTGAVEIDRSVIQSNPGRHNGQYLGFYVEATDKQGTTGITVTASTIE